MRIGRINKYSAEHFDRTKESGLSFIEICCNNAAEADNLINAKEDVKKQIVRTGIDVSSVGRWNHDLNENGKINADKEAQYIALMDAAIELGAKTFVCGINKDDSISLYRNYVNAVEFLGKLVDHADRRIKVAVLPKTGISFSVKFPSCISSTTRRTRITEMQTISQSFPIGATE